MAQRSIGSAHPSAPTGLCATRLIRGRGCAADVCLGRGSKVEVAAWSCSGNETRRWEQSQQMATFRTLRHSLKPPLTLRDASLTRASTSFPFPSGSARIRTPSTHELRLHFLVLLRCSVSRRGETMTAGAGSTGADLGLRLTHETSSVAFRSNRQWYTAIIIA